MAYFAELDSENIVEFVWNLSSNNWKETGN